MSNRRDVNLSLISIHVSPSLFNRTQTIKTGSYTEGTTKTLLLFAVPALGAVAVANRRRLGSMTRRAGRSVRALVGSKASPPTPPAPKLLTSAAPEETAATFQAAEVAAAR